MREQRRRGLLAIDSIINAVLGICLLGAPQGTIEFFGLPRTENLFYVTVLGAVLLGIGMALWIERRNVDRWRGLGLAGAIVINLLGAGTVLVWLILDPFTMPARGYFVLWSVTLIVFATALAESMALFRRGSCRLWGGRVLQSDAAGSASLIPRFGAQTGLPTDGRGATFELSIFFCGQRLTRIARSSE